jgi:SAM-dependent methyltransferase
VGALAEANTQMSTRSPLATIAKRLGAGRSSRPDWHRDAVGGKWEVLGKLQFDFLVAEGLTPEHYLLDIGCGSLRGGLHFIDYLAPGHYAGIEQNAEVLAAGTTELENAGVTDKDPQLAVRNDFAATGFGQSFDFALAQSVFTHLTFNSIVRCLAEVDRVLKPGGRFYATFFASPGPRLHIEEMIRTGFPNAHVDRDPYYYDPDLFSWICEGSQLTCEYRGKWEHPGDSRMLVFTRQPARAHDG